MLSSQAKECNKTYSACICAYQSCFVEKRLLRFIVTNVYCLFSHSVIDSWASPFEYLFGLWNVYHDRYDPLNDTNFLGSRLLLVLMQILRDSNSNTNFTPINKTYLNPTKTVAVNMVHTTTTQFSWLWFTTSVWLKKTHVRSGRWR